MQDAFGNTVTGNSSNVTATINTGSGSLQGTVTVAAVAGVVSFSNLRIDTAGAKTLHFTDGALTAVDTSPFTVSAAAASQLALTTQPAGATAGAAFTTQPVVTIQDAFGNTVTGNSTSVTATINTGSGSLQGTTTVAAVAGVVSFSNLRIDSAGAKTLQLTDGALTSVNSGSFTVSPGAASQLVVSTQPAGATAGSVFVTQPVLAVQDAFGNTVTSDTSSVTATINSGTGSLAGTTTVAAVNGVASFTNLRIDTAGAEDAPVRRRCPHRGQLRLLHRLPGRGRDAASRQWQLPDRRHSVQHHRHRQGRVRQHRQRLPGHRPLHKQRPAGPAAQQLQLPRRRQRHPHFTNAVTLKTAGAENLIATDTITTTITGTQNGISVTAAAASQLALTTQPAGATAGAPFTTQPLLTVQDAYGNTVTGNSSNVTATLNTGSGTSTGRPRSPPSTGSPASRTCGSTRPVRRHSTSPTVRSPRSTPAPSPSQLAAASQLALTTQPAVRPPAPPSRRSLCSR